MTEEILNMLDHQDILNRLADTIVARIKTNDYRNTKGKLSKAGQNACLDMMVTANMMLDPDKCWPAVWIASIRGVDEFLADRS